MTFHKIQKPQSVKDCGFCGNINPRARTSCISRATNTSLIPHSFNPRARTSCIRDFHFLFSSLKVSIPVRVRVASCKSQIQACSYQVSIPVRVRVASSMVNAVINNDRFQSPCAYELHLRSAEIRTKPARFNPRARTSCISWVFSTNGYSACFNPRARTSCIVSRFDNVNEWPTFQSPCAYELHRYGCGRIRHSRRFNPRARTSCILMMRSFSERFIVSIPVRVRVASSMMILGSRKSPTVSIPVRVRVASYCFISVPGLKIGFNPRARTSCILLHH